MADTSTVAEHLYLDSRLDAPESLSLAGGRVCVYSSPCPGREGANEDAAALLPFGDDAAVLAVADGLGGSAAGEHASRVVIQSLQREVDKARGTDTLLRTAIINALEQANESIQALGIGAATTLAAVEVNRAAIRTYHVGDSGILVTGGRGRIRLQTVAHSPVGYGVESGLLDEAEAMHHEDRHVVSNVVGSAAMSIDIGPTLSLRPRDTLLVASDGVFDNLSIGELANLIRKGPLPRVAASLRDVLEERMNHPTADTPTKPDDATFILFRV
ncbi:MAG: PP2C family serine/threonine-protein phosphatase [Pirellulales bacterium]